MLKMTSMRRRKSVFQLCLAFVWIISTGAAPTESRNWTSAEGKNIEAEFVEFDGSTVTLRMRSKLYQLPLGKLSSSDQDWLKEWKEKKTAEDETRLKTISGLRKDVAIDHRYAANTDGYFKGPFGKDLRSFNDNRCSIVDEPAKGVFMNCAESVAWESEKMRVFCPPSYTGE